jgi:hypothetical protein
MAGFGTVSESERVTGDNIVFKDKINGNAVSFVICFDGVIFFMDFFYSKL